MKSLLVLMSVVTVCCAFSPGRSTPVLEELVEAMRGRYELSKITAFLEELIASGEVEKEFYGNRLNLKATYCITISNFFCFSHSVSDYEGCQPFCSYTFFAPNDEAYNSVYIADAGDPFYNKNFRKEFILSHFYSEYRQSLQDLQGTTKLQMANSKTVSVSNNRGEFSSYFSAWQVELFVSHTYFYFQSTVGAIQLNQYATLKDAIDAKHGIIYIIDAPLVEYEEITKAAFSRY